MNTIGSKMNNKLTNVMGNKFSNKMHTMGHKMIPLMHSPMVSKISNIMMPKSEMYDKKIIEGIKMMGNKNEIKMKSRKRLTK